MTSRTGVIAWILLFWTLLVSGSWAFERSRLIIETDAGGDPDDEQSLVRFLLYANEWDVEGIIANRPAVRDGENLNPVRTGLGVVERLLGAYGVCWTNLVQHDSRFPSEAYLRQRAVAGYNDTDSAVKLIIAAVDRADPRPVWYSDWGTDSGGSTNNLRRALDTVLQERGREAYAVFKSKLRLTSYDMFGAHTTNIAPPFRLWVNTFQPPVEGKRWYHRFSGLTARAGGFDVARDLLNGHGPLGAMYPLNTTHPQKEGDSMTFLYLVPTGMNDPERPTWGSWAGRYGKNDNYPGLPYYWANQRDQWQGKTHRDNTLARWAAALQNDFRARLDWCVQPTKGANHPPRVQVEGGRFHTVALGHRLGLSAGRSSDPDEDALAFQWEIYSEAGDFDGIAELRNADKPDVTVAVDKGPTNSKLHLILSVTDSGQPPLTRYERVIISVRP